MGLYPRCSLVPKTLPSGRGEKGVRKEGSGE